MTNAEFEHVLRRAIGGSEEDLELILKLYEPLIYKYSCIKGEYDEDMHQQLLLHILIVFPFNAGVLINKRFIQFKDQFQVFLASTNGPTENMLKFRISHM